MLDHEMLMVSRHEAEVCYKAFHRKKKVKMKMKNAGGKKREMQLRESEMKESNKDSPIYCLQKAAAHL